MWLIIALAFVFFRQSFPCPTRAVTVSDLLRAKRYDVISVHADIPVPFPMGEMGARQTRRRLTLDERRSYIGAVKCMMAKPGIAPLEAVTNRFEDFLATHIVQAMESHFVVSWPPPFPGVVKDDTIYFNCYVD